MPRHDQCRKDDPKAAPEARSNSAPRFSAGLARTMTQVPEGRPTFAPICGFYAPELAAAAFASAVSSLCSSRKTCEIRSATSNGFASDGTF
jgi:hypothetical protein